MSLSCFSEEEPGAIRRSDRDTAERDHVLELAVDADLVGDVVLVRPGVRRLIGGVYRSRDEEKQDHRDRNEQRQERQRRTGNQRLAARHQQNPIP